MALARKLEAAAVGVAFPLSVLGNLVRVVSFVSLGYLFASSWEVIDAFAGSLSRWMADTVLVAVGAYKVYAPRPDATRNTRR